jgi:hypothetical protein
MIHTFPIDTLSANKSKKGTTGDNSSEWESTVLMDGNRTPYVLSSYIVASIKKGGKPIKVGKSTMEKKVESCLECCDDIILFEGLTVPMPEHLTRLTTDPVYLDVRSVVNPATKGRNLRYRISLKPGWILSTTIQWDDYAVSSDTMKNCIENAGLFEGIGDGRRIGFGRFKLLNFKIIS